MTTTLLVRDVNGNTLDKCELSLTVTELIEAQMFDNREGIVLTVEREPFDHEDDES